MREEPRQTDEQCSAVVVAEVVGLPDRRAAAFKQLLSRERRQSPKGLPSLARSLAGASFSSLQRSARALSRRSRNCDDGRGRRPREGRLVRFLCVCARCLPSSRRLSRFI